MNPRQTALARSHTYSLFSQLYQQGLTQELLTYVNAINVPDTLVPTRLDRDQQAAIHQALFGFNVFPFESVFVDAPSLLGGHATMAVGNFYEQAGYEPPESDTAVDHIAAELGLLAFLTSMEAKGWDEQRVDAVTHSQNLQGQFLDQHLLPWLPALTLAIAQQGESLFEALTALTLELALDHRQALGRRLSSPPAPFRLPETPSLLTNPSTGLKDVAAYLLTPAHSGFYLSRDDIARLGRQFHLPRGFGDRRQMLTNLLRSAAEYDSLPVLVGELLRFVSIWQEHYRHLRDASPVAMENIATVWIKRLSGTDTLLAELGKAESKKLS